MIHWWTFSFDRYIYREQARHKEKSGAFLNSSVKSRDISDVFNLKSWFFLSFLPKAAYSGKNFLFQSTGTSLV